MKQRIGALDATRGIAVAAMVLWHVSLSYGPGGHVMFQTGSRAFATFRMPVLMLISGYLASGMLQASGRKIVHRLTHFAWIYGFWLVALVGINEQSAPFDVAFYVSNFIDPKTALWFVWDLAIFTTITPFLRLFPRVKVLMVVFALSVATDVGWIAANHFAIDYALLYAPMFFVGVLYRPEIERQLAEPAQIRLLMIALGCVASVAVLEKTLLHFAGIDVLIGIRRMAVCLAALYIIKAVVEYCPPIKVLQGLGRNTLPVYVMHMPLLILAKPYVGELAGPFSPAVFTTALIGGALLLHHLVRTAGWGWAFERPIWMVQMIDRVGATGVERTVPIKANETIVQGLLSRSGAHIRDRLHRHDPALDRHDARRRALWQIRTGRRPAAVADPHPAAALAQFGVHGHDLADQAARPVVEPQIALDRIVAIPASPDPHAHHAPQGEGDDLRDRRQIG